LWRPWGLYRRASAITVRLVRRCGENRETDVQLSYVPR
jgi:hypothetical protein